MPVQQEGPLICFTGGPLTFGQVTFTSGNATALPNITSIGRGRLVWIRAKIANAAVFAIGGAGVTLPTTGVTNTTAGQPLQPGEWLPFPIPIAELHNWYTIGTSGDGLTYTVQG